MSKGGSLSSSLSHHPLNTMRAEVRQWVESCGRCTSPAVQPSQVVPRYQAVFRNRVPTLTGLGAGEGGGQPSLSRGLEALSSHPSRW